MRICFERLCFATKRPAVDEDQLPQLDDIKSINSINPNSNYNSISTASNTTPITSITTSPAINQYSKYIKNNNKDNNLNNNNNKSHNYQNISFDTGISKSLINSTDINSQHQSKINNKQIINQINETNTNIKAPIINLDNQNKISEYSENSNSQTTTFAIIGDKVVNINNIEYTIATGGIPDTTNKIFGNNIIDKNLEKMHQQESPNNCQLETGTTPELTASVTGTIQSESINNNNISNIPADILQTSLIYGPDVLTLNEPNLDIETINYIHKQQQQLQKLYQQQLQNQLQHIQQQAQTLFQPNIQQISDNDASGNVNSNLLLGSIAPPPSSLPLPLTFQQHQQNLMSSNQQLSANEFNNNNMNNNNNNSPVIVNSGVADQIQGLCLNSVDSTSSAMVVLSPNMITNNSYIASTPQEQQFVQLIQVKDLKIQELQRVLQFKENEIAELKSHLDKFQSVFPFSRSSSGGGGGSSTSISTTPTGPGLRKTGQAFQRQRAQGISAEPQSESSVMELLHVTFPKYDKEER